MTSHPLDDTRQSELDVLAHKASRARRLAADMTDPAVRKCFVELAFETEAKMEEIRKLGRPGPAGPERG